MTNTTVRDTTGQDTDAGAPSAADAVSVPTRRVSFDDALQDLPRHFARDGDLVSSHVIAMLSSVFPDGEDFFVRSVRHYRKRIDDPELSTQVAGFIGQESIHGREHRALNGRLAELGYRTRQVEWVTRRFLAVRERVMTPKANLAMTAALEHFTATLAELVLTDEQMRLGAGAQGVQELLLWHALEESEHKAVAFDVYRAIGGSERTRVLTMKLIRTLFVVSMSTFVAISLLGDRATYRPRTLLASLRTLRDNPVFGRDIREQLRDYDRADFHPNDRDTTALVQEWRHELFGPAGTMNQRLTGRRPAA